MCCGGSFTRKKGKSSRYNNTVYLFIYRERERERERRERRERVGEREIERETNLLRELNSSIRSFSGCGPKSVIPVP